MGVLLTVLQRGRVLGVVAILGAWAVLLVKLLAEVMQQEFAPACGRLRVSHDFLQQLHAHLLFRNGFALQELFQLVDVFVAVERDAMAFASVASARPVSW